MRPRDREVEIDEAQVTLTLIVALTVVAGVFYVGLWVGGWLAGGRLSPPPAPAGASLGARTPLPVGFIGPPLPAYPPPVAGRPGGGRSGNLAIAVRNFTDRSEAEGALRQLIAEGYPAYLAVAAQDRWQLRVGDYGTLAEAESVRAQLSAAGATESGLLEL